MLNGLILTLSEAHTARLHAIAAFNIHGTGITSFNANNKSAIKQYEVVCFKNEDEEFQVYVVDKERTVSQGSQSELFLAQACLDETDPHSNNVSLVAVKIASGDKLKSDMQVEYQALVRLCRAKGFCTISLGDLVQSYLFSEYLPSLDQAPKTRRSSDKISSSAISLKKSNEGHNRKRSQSAVPHLEISRIYPERSGVLRSPSSADRSPKVITPKSASSKASITPHFDGVKVAAYIPSTKPEELPKLEAGSSPRKEKQIKFDS
jgi:hypothetical protein